MRRLLTDEDSKRVADALIAKIDECDVDIHGAVYDAVKETLVPKGREVWKDDWFPLVFEEMANKIERGIIQAAYQASEKL